jgi:hypothetical protein
MFKEIKYIGNIFLTNSILNLSPINIYLFGAYRKIPLSFSGK